MTPFAVVPRFAVEQCQGPDAIALLTLIALNTGTDGWCRASHAQLGGSINRSKQWVQLAMRRLAETRVLVLQERPRGEARPCRLIYDESVPLPKGTDQQAGRSDQQAGPPSSSSSSINQPTSSEVIKKKRDQSRMIPLAKDWRPAPDVWQWAIGARPDLDTEDTFSDFKTYYLAKGNGQISWDLTFKNWIRTTRPTLRPVASGGDSGGTAKLGRDETRARITAAAAGFARRGGAG